MNDLTIRAEMAQTFPTLIEGLRKAQSILDSITSFEDIERVFLKGAGLAANTYRNYLGSVRAFYQYTEGKHPLQVTAADIECFYDDLLTRVDRSTAYIRIAGLKKFFSGIRNVLPIYTSPFETMTDKLHRKLNRTRKGKQTKKAMTQAEAKRLITWLAEDRTVRGVEDHAIALMLLTSGLRASELCQLKWGSLDATERTWTARFIGKGGDPAEQELFPGAVEAARVYFIAAFRREPRPEDALFWTVPAFPGERPAALAYHTLWRRVREIGERALAAGILTRELQFTPHLFRRSYASCLYRSGMGLKAIQEKTRHASLEVLTRHYIDDSAPASPFFAKILEGVAV